MGGNKAQLMWHKENGSLRRMAMKDLASLEQHVSLLLNDEPNGKKPITYILRLEEADSIVALEHLERTYSC